MKNKLNRIFKSVAGEVTLWWMWIKNIVFVFATTKSQVHIFQGYGHWWFARRYADKRAKISQINMYCGAKRHYVLPIGEYSLGVFSSDDLQALRRKNIIKKGFKIDSVLKNSYYVTK